MTRTLRIAARKFDPFERALTRQFEDFVRASGEDARLELQSFDLNPLHDLLFKQRALDSGEFDIAFLTTDWVAEAQSAGIIADLTPHLNRAPVADYPEGWSPSLLKLQSFDGGVWGMPYHDGPQCLIYRKDLLANAGLQPPKTWDEFVAAAERLHAPESNLYGTVLALYPDGHNSFYDFCVHVWTRGGEPFDDRGRPQFLTPQAIAALDFVRGFAANANAIAPGAQQTDSVQAGLMFCDGKVALMTNWFGFAALGDSVEGPVKGKVEIAPLPAGPGGASVSLNVFWMLTLARGAREPELTWDFMRHAATAPMDRLTTIEGAIGVRRSTWIDPEINQRIPYYNKLEALHAAAREMPRHARLSAMAQAVDEMLTRALSSSTPSRELLGVCQSAIERSLA